MTGDGLGNFGMVYGTDGKGVKISEDAYNAIYGANNMNPTSLSFGKFGSNGSLSKLQHGKGLAASAGNSWMGKGGYLDLGLQGIQAGTGLMNAYLGYKNYKLAKDQFGFEKAAANRNILNEGTMLNNQMDNAQRVGNALAGNSQTEAQKQANLAEVAKRHVNTSAIG